MSHFPPAGPAASSSSPYATSANSKDTAPENITHDSAVSLDVPLLGFQGDNAGLLETAAGADTDDNAHEPFDDDDVDTGFDDNDSAFGGSLIGCDTDTLSSFVTDYRYENGRRYHSYRDGEYWGPNDEIANELHDMAHHMYLMTLEGRLHLAPIQNPHNILDLGTGTGIWAIEMADINPSAKVVGTDLSPIQPLFVPPNLQFEIEDMNSSWTYPKNHFDFIHMRELFGCVSDWPGFFKQAYEHTKPGGYVEILEHSVWPVSDDDTVNESSFFTNWGQTVISCGEKLGKSFNIWKESKELMEQAGFIDIVETRYKWPMNGWPSPEHRTHGNDGDKSWKRLREIGVWNQLRLYDGVESFMLRLLTTTIGWSYEQAQLYLATMRKEVQDLSIHAYLDVSVVYGRKPGGNPRPGEPTVSYSQDFPLRDNPVPEGCQSVLGNF